MFRMAATAIVVVGFCRDSWCPVRAQSAMLERTRSQTVLLLLQMPSGSVSVLCSESA